MIRRLTLAASLLALAGCAGGNEPAPAAPAAPAAPPAAQAAATPSSRTDFSNTANWLCRPGKADDACKVNIDATVVNADGSTSVEKFEHNPNAPIDCFYVYPTVSLDPFTYSDLIPGPEELNVVRSQLARFGESCRLFAPIYRQFSLGALRARSAGGAAPETRGSPVDGTTDVNDAWAWYLANENKGRGVVILGHSQGSGQITRLIASEIDGKPIQDKLVSAVILGSSVQVPAGKDVGGSFKSIPVCKTADQFGCVLSYSTYRETVPPSATAGFGIGRNGNEAVCTNPAALGGGEAKNPDAYFSTGNIEWTKGKKIDTPFVKVPGLISTECVKKDAHHYLEVRLHADPNDARADDHGGDVMAQGKPDPSWGLHLVDANVGIGDLVNIVAKQGAAWKKAHP